MSDNPRMQKWLEKMDEGKKRNPKAPLQFPSSSEKPQIIRQEIVYIPQGTIYVGFWRRVFAMWIDSILVSIVLYLLHTNLIINCIISFLYYTYCPSTKMQGTIGKLAIGAKIVDAQGQCLSYMHSVGRFFAQILSSLLLLVGYIMVAFHAKKRGLHDLIADTYVINK